MRAERTAFLTALLSRCGDYPAACLTLSAIHPDGQHPTPSRHIRLNNRHTLQAALDALDEANAQGWGAYFAVGLRRPGLSRWQRGGMADVVVLPALFVDVDDASSDALERLRAMQPAPSCIVHSGGGFHGYWWLHPPSTDLAGARACLHRLAADTGGDRMSVAQSMRLVDSINNKPGRARALCRLVELTDRTYPLSAFEAAPTETRWNHSAYPRMPARELPRDRIGQVSAALLLGGGKRRGDWISARCPFPARHKHADRQPSFGFNTKTGYGYCHVCGTLLLKDLCAALGIETASYSRAYTSSGYDTSNQKS